MVRRYDAAENPLPAGTELLVAHDDTDRQLSPEWSLALHEAHRPRARLVRTSGFGHVTVLASDSVLDAVTAFAKGGLAAFDRQATAPAPVPPVRAALRSGTMGG